jgi:nucleoside diphosphate kinase
MAITRQECQIVTPTKAFTREIIDATYFKDEQSKRHLTEILVGSQDRQAVDDIIYLLLDPFTNKLIDNGKITFAAIKPQPADSKLGTSSHVEAENILLDMIAKPPFDILCKITISPSAEDIQKFYPDSVVKKLSSMKTEDPHKNNWEVFKEFMLSGPVTYFLLYNPHGDAIDSWRSKTGATNPQKADAESIRGKYAKNISNNLVHGSNGDSPEEKIKEVHREKNWLLAHLNKIKYYNDKNRINLDSFSFVPKDSLYIASKRIKEATAVISEKNGEISINYHPC